MEIKYPEKPIDNKEQVNLREAARQDVDLLVPGCIEKKYSKPSVYDAIKERLWGNLKELLKSKRSHTTAIATAFLAALPIFSQEVSAEEYGHSKILTPDNKRSLSVDGLKFYESSVNLEEFNEFSLNDGDYELKLGSFSPRKSNIDPSPFIKIDKIIQKEDGSFSYDFSAGLTVMDLNYQTSYDSENQLVAIPKISAGARKEISIDDDIKIVLAGIGQAYGNVMQMFKSSIDVGSAFEGAIGGSIIARIEGGSVSFYAINEVAGISRDIQQQRQNLSNISIVDAQNSLGIKLKKSINGRVLSFNPEITENTWGSKFGIEISSEKAGETFFAKFSKIKSEHPFLIPSGEEVEAGARLTNREKDRTLEIWAKREADHQVSAGLTFRWGLGKSESTYQKEYQGLQPIEITKLNLNDFREMEIVAEEIKDDFFIEKGPLLISEYSPVDSEKDTLTINAVSPDQPYQKALNYTWLRNNQNGHILLYRKYILDNADFMENMKKNNYDIMTDEEKKNAKLYIQKTQYQYESEGELKSGEYEIYIDVDYMNEIFERLRGEVIATSETKNTRRLGRIVQESKDYQEFVSRANQLPEKEKIILLHYLSSNFYLHNYNYGAIEGKVDEVVRANNIKPEDLFNAIKQSAQDEENRLTTVCGGISKFLANLSKDIGLGDVYIISGNTKKTGHFANLIATKEGFLIIDADEIKIATGNIAQAIKSYQEKFKGSPGFKHYVFTPAGELVCWILTPEGKVLKDVIGVKQDVSAEIKKQITK